MLPFYVLLLLSIIIVIIDSAVSCAPWKWVIYNELLFLGLAFPGWPPVWYVRRVFFFVFCFRFGCISFVLYTSTYHSY